jgi:hypothetical protein
MSNPLYKKLLSLFYIFMLFGCNPTSNPGLSDAPTVGAEYEISVQVTLTDQPSPTSLDIPPVSTPTVMSEPANDIHLEKGDFTLSTTAFKTSNPYELDYFARHGVPIELKGIYALDRNTAFIFGAFSEGGEGYRSVILKTINGGDKWYEVMQPSRRCVVNHLIMLEDGKGWATVADVSEGVMGTSLWTTDDYGESWEKGDYITGLNTYILGIRFIDDQSGQIWVLQEKGMPDDGGYLYNTRDGGRFFTLTFQINVTDENGELIPDSFDNIISAFSETPGGNYGSHWEAFWKDHSESAVGMDASAWVVSADETGQYTIDIQGLDGSLTRIHLPIAFQYQDGLITP